MELKKNKTLSEAFENKIRTMFNDVILKNICFGEKIKKKDICSNNVDKIILDDLFSSLKNKINEHIELSDFEYNKSLEIINLLIKTERIDDKYINTNKKLTLTNEKYVNIYDHLYDKIKNFFKNDFNNFFDIKPLKNDDVLSTISEKSELNEYDNNENELLNEKKKLVKNLQKIEKQIWDIQNKKDEILPSDDNNCSECILINNSNWITDQKNVCNSCTWKCDICPFGTSGINDLYASVLK